MTRDELYRAGLDLIETVVIPALKEVTTRAKWFVRNDGISTNKSGVHITLLSGNVLSIQWFDGNYSNIGRMQWTPGEDFTFECAGIRPNGDFIPGDFGGDEVIGWATIPQVIRYALTIAK